MKTAEEWTSGWMKDWTVGVPCTLRELIKQVQSDAFHAGKMEGLQEAKEIVRDGFLEKLDDEDDRIENEAKEQT